MRRVVVTGIGVVAPNGNTARAFWSACADGKSGIGRITGFDTTGFPTNIAGEVQGFDVVPFVKDRRVLKLLNRHIQFALGAAHEAVKDAGLATAQIDSTR